MDRENMSFPQFETIEQKQQYLRLRWIRNRKVRAKLLGFRFSSVWEIEKYARVNLKQSKFLYHGTQEQKLNKILKDRTLKPFVVTGEINYIELSHKESVYVTTNKDMASKFAYWSIRNIPALENWKEKASINQNMSLYVSRKEKAFVIAIPKKLLAHRLRIDENLQCDGESFRIEGPVRLTPECTIEEVIKEPSD